ncbi:hypothetical protein GCM10008179_12250 [Hansschlegelia plantiphila]|uniref:Uncharacterized protein n=1 Tax=Hansschlegelia plantiphila TaxID=374655 RepID=A0A9W6MV51_9HYPH|nr:hypothetical protein GCM10008179_12250 [Hansschlegelia plantiphila]
MNSHVVIPAAAKRNAGIHIRDGADRGAPAVAVHCGKRRASGFRHFGRNDGGEAAEEALQDDA